jgi:hypothetical protein
MGFIGLAFMVALLLPAILPHLGRVYGRVGLEMARILVLPLPETTGDVRLRKMLGKRKTLKASEARVVLGYLGQRYQPVLLFLTAVMLVITYRREPGRRYRTVHDMWSLLKISSRHFPCLKPIIKTGPITAQPHFEGGWALAKTPLQFVLEEGLLLDPGSEPYKISEILDPINGLPRAGNPALGRENSLCQERLWGLLADQLGQSFNGDMTRLPLHQWTVAAALVAHSLDRKDLAFKIFDQLSTDWDPRSRKVDARAIGRLFPDLVQAANSLAALLAHQSFVNVWFMGLLDLARTRGALPSSLWIWLKPTDRTLFYSLNQVGSDVAWVEAVGPFCHYESEKRAKRSLTEPSLEPAVASLVKYLCDADYLQPDMVSTQPAFSATPLSKDKGAPLAVPLEDLQSLGRLGEEVIARIKDRREREMLQEKNHTDLDHRGCDSGH